MSDLLNSLQEIGQILFFGSFFCVFPLVTIGLLIYQFVTSLNQRKAAQKLAETMGLAPLNESSHFTNVWYGQVKKGRKFAIKPIVRLQRSHSGHDGRRNTLKVTLRVAVPVNMPRPEAINLYHTIKKGIPPTFDEAFSGEGAEKLTPAGRTTLLAFIHKIYPIGLSKDLNFRLRSRTRHLHLAQRGAASTALIAQGVLADAPAVLIHDHLNPNISPADLQQLVADLTAVATALETGRVPPQLANQTPPTESPYEKFILPATLLLSLVIIPSCFCLCSVFLFTP